MSKQSSEADDDEIKPKKNHLISRKKFREFMATHPGNKTATAPFFRWCKTVEQAAWMEFSDVKATFNNADLVGQNVVFNVEGNKYRVVASIKYKKDRPAWVYIKHVLTHKEYDKGEWKDSS